LQSAEAGRAGVGIRIGIGGAGGVGVLDESLERRLEEGLLGGKWISVKVEEGWWTGEMSGEGRTGRGAGLWQRDLVGGGSLGLT